MYGFLILLPLTLISLLIGFLVASSTQVADYIAYISHPADPKPLLLNEIWSNQRVLALIGAHVIAYAVLCFTAVELCERSRRRCRRIGPGQCGSFKCCWRSCSSLCRRRSCYGSWAEL